MTADAGVELVLDPGSVELSTPGGIDRSGILDLPWSSNGLDTPRTLAGREDVLESFPSDRVIRAARVLPQLSKQRKRLDDWRETISEIRASNASKRPSSSLPISSMGGSSFAPGGAARRYIGIGSIERN